MNTISSTSPDKTANSREPMQQMWRKEKQETQEP